MLRWSEVYDKCDHEVQPFVRPFSCKFHTHIRGDREPDSEEKIFPQNGPQNGPEMQFLFSDIYQLPKLSRDLPPDLSFRIEKGISVLTIFTFLSVL